MDSIACACMPVPACILRPEYITFLCHFFLDGASCENSACAGCAHYWRAALGLTACRSIWDALQLVADVP